VREPWRVVTALLQADCVLCCSLSMALWAAKFIDVDLPGRRVEGRLLLVDGDRLPSQQPRLVVSLGGFASDVAARARSLGAECIAVMPQALPVLVSNEADMQPVEAKTGPAPRSIQEQALGRQEEKTWFAEVAGQRVAVPAQLLEAPEAFPGLALFAAPKLFLLQKVLPIVRLDAELLASLAPGPAKCDVHGSRTGG